jgi:hypothetical protein
VLSFCPFAVSRMEAEQHFFSCAFLTSSLTHLLTYFYCILTCSLFSLLVPVIVEMEWLSDPNPSCADLVKRLKAGGAVE